MQAALWLAAALLGGTVIAQGEAHSVRLASAAWPPYIDAELPGLGASAVAVRTVLASQGLELQVHLLPWSRAVRTGLQQPGFAGYFPEYDTPETRRRCHLSPAVGSGPLGFAYRRSSGFSWQQLSDLAGLRIGIVGGYVSTAAFDRAVARGELQVDTALDDAQNLLKLANQRVDIAMVDKHVYDYLLRRDARLGSHAAQLQFHPQLLQSPSLHVCFKRNRDGAALRKRFAQGLTEVDVDALLRVYMAALPS